MTIPAEKYSTRIGYMLHWFTQEHSENFVKQLLSITTLCSFLLHVNEWRNQNADVSKKQNGMNMFEI